jgi:hypothetical protein
MLVDSIAAYLLLNKKKMPLTDNLEHLRRYISLNVEDDTIRVVTGPGGIKGVALWKMTTAEKGEPGIWEHSDPDGDIIVMYHIVTDSLWAVGRLAGYILEKYPGLKEMWGERSGRNRKFSVEYLKRLTRAKFNNQMKDQSPWANQ